MDEVTVLKNRVAQLEAVIRLAEKVCGKNNCNCPNSKRVKDAIVAINLGEIND